MDHQWIINNYVSFQEVLSNTHTQSFKESDDATYKESKIDPDVTFIFLVWTSLYMHTLRKVVCVICTEWNQQVQINLSGVI